MKKILQLFLAFSILVCLASCKGDDGKDGAPGPAGPAGTPGAQGPVGPQGPPGTSADTAQVFDFPAPNFEADDDGNYEIGIDFAANDIEVGETDIVLAYLLTRVGQSNGQDIPFWSALPQTYYVDGSPITFNYAYSNLGLILSLEAGFNLAEPGKDYTRFTNNNVYRIVLIPGRVGGRTTGKPLTKADLSKFPVDLNDYNAVVKYFKIKDANVKTLKLK
ncbi:hypothetical protein [Adhaeribacter pallidiroseus]|uniref:Short-chain collagen C4 n=1 Tax=Adhaeribacter pallidiroseus TaxID=2072847 RepID=A0A369QJS5_9BACT|nr:hypothetical protein [Adhaeribacter pallidiroseus]RDC64642.1 Short-chain collagen C4 [Adhaeribacter pallidiroseus]